MTAQATPDPALAEVGRCGQTFRGIVLNGERPTACCDLLAGHPGWHRDRAHGMEWGATDSADALASLRADLTRERAAAEQSHAAVAQTAEKLSAARAELARVRPVVAAAREVAAEYDEGSGAIVVGWKLSLALTQLAAALDGDAAATPEAVRCDSDEVDDCSCGAAAGPSAPPVDATAGLRAAAHAAFSAMDKGVLMSETGDGAESVLAVGHLHLIAEYLERHPDWPSAQAIVRALATPTTEETAR